MKQSPLGNWRLTPMITVCVARKNHRAFQLLNDSLSLGTIAHTVFIVEDGAESIAKAYNRMLAKTMKGENWRNEVSEYVIFTHDDVEILSNRWAMDIAMNKLEEADCGIVGVAGTRRLNQSGVWWDGRVPVGATTPVLSGAVMHADRQSKWMTSFGKYGQVAVLDGVFLMAKPQTLQKLGGWDESYEGFDFYDLDITLRAHLAGLKNWTVPVLLKHMSIGDTSQKPQWEINRQKFLQKFNGNLPCSI